MMNVPFALAALVVAATLSGCASHTAPGSSSSTRAESPASSGDSGAGPQTPARTPLADTAAAQTSAFDPEGSLPPVRLSPEILFQILAADIAVQRGEFGAAWNTYMSLAKQTRDPRLARRATETAFSARALDEATQSAVLWRELAPQSPAAAQALEALWLNTGRLTEVEPLLRERLVRGRADGTLPDVYNQLQRSLARTADHKAAWQLIQRLSEPDLKIPAARVARATLAAAAEDYPAAVEEARQAMRLAPDDEDAVLVAARSMWQLPDSKNAALDLLDDFIKRSPKSLEARYLYARMLLGEGKIDAARAQFDAALAQSPDNPALLLSVAQAAYQAKQPDESRRYLERYLALPAAAARDRSTATFLMAQIAEDAGKTDEAVAWLAKVPPGDDYMPATVRRALLLSKAGRIDEARQLLRTTPAGSARDQTLLVTAEAQLLREAGRNQESFDVLGAALAKSPDNTDLLYDYAMAAERIDRFPVMETSLRRLIELRPDQPHGYNALGYTLADRGVRLDEARSLIEKALSLAPNDAHILDSMGWVLYRQKDTAGALRYLRQAYAARQEVDIAAHLGEVLWAEGKQDEARQLWREARTREPANTTLRETLTRLNVTL
jgi:tetratricopeptide (TPR) repeat protein